MMTRAQTEAIATAVTRVRDWDHPGVMAALKAASHLGSPAAVAAALFRLADDPETRSPARLASPGPHWVGTAVASKRPPTMCGLHPTERALDCRPCADDLAGVDHAAHAAAIRRGLRAHTKPPLTAEDARRAPQETP